MSEKRTDPHVWSNFEPSDYDYLGSFDSDSGPGCFPLHDDYAYWTKLLADSPHEGHWKSKHGCDHCGASIRYVVVWRHKPTGEVIASGETCATERFGSDSKHVLEVRMLRKAAASRAEKERAHAAALEWVREKAPDLETLLDFPVPESRHDVLKDMGRRLAKYGSMSEKAVRYARRLLAEDREREKNGGKTDRELEFEAEKASRIEAPEGRVTVRGKVLSTRVDETDWGTSFKMLVLDDRNFTVWSTIPSDLHLFDDPKSGNYRALERGDRVEFAATLSHGRDDKTFAIAKRPTKAKYLGSAA